MLPSVIGAVAGTIVGLVLSWLFPPEHAIDRTYCLILHGGLLCGVGVFGGYVWALLAAKSIRPHDAAAIVLLPLSLAGFFVIGPMFLLITFLCAGYLFFRIIVLSGGSGREEPPRGPGGSASPPADS